MLTKSNSIKEVELQDLIRLLQEIQVEISLLKGEMKKKASERYFTVAETCELLKVSRSTLYRMTANNDLPARRAYRRLLFAEKDINKLLITKNV